jgi:hypothetical protein
MTRVRVLNAFDARAACAARAAAREWTMVEHDG